MVDPVPRSQLIWPTLSPAARAAIMARAKLTFTLVLGSTFLACGAATVAEAARPTVAQSRSHRSTPLVLSSVTSRAGAARSESQLREDIADALDDASFDGVPAGRRFLLSATLMELERSGSSGSTITSSTIELAVLEGSSGRIIGVVRGHAQVEAAPGDREADGDAVRAAAKGAVESAVVVARTQRP
jgi:hypothetical protein